MKRYLGTVEQFANAEQLNKINAFPSLRNVEVWENDRSARRAGAAFYFLNKIELHSQLLKPGREKELHETFMHELGHMWAFQAHGARGHGPIWQKVMAILGMPNCSRTHDLGYISEGKKKHVYICDACGVEVTRFRRLKHSGVYLHTNCPKKKQEPRQSSFSAFVRSSNNVMIYRGIRY